VQTHELTRTAGQVRFLENTFAESLPDERQVPLNEVPHAARSCLPQTAQLVQRQNHNLHGQHVLAVGTLYGQNHQGGTTGVRNVLHVMLQSRQHCAKPEDRDSLVTALPKRYKKLASRTTTQLHSDIVVRHKRESECSIAWVGEAR